MPDRFLLCSSQRTSASAIRLFGVELVDEAITDAATRVTRYLRMQFMINAGYGTSVADPLWAVLGVPNALMWGVLGFMLRFLPYIGPVLAASMPIAIAAAVGNGELSHFY